MENNYERQSKEIRTIYVDGETFHKFKQICAVEGTRASNKIEELIREYVNSKPNITKLFTKDESTRL